LQLGNNLPIVNGVVGWRQRCRHRNRYHIFITTTRTNSYQSLASFSANIAFTSIIIVWSFPSLQGAPLLIACHLLSCVCKPSFRPPEGRWYL